MMSLANPVWAGEEQPGTGRLGVPVFTARYLHFGSLELGSSVGAEDAILSSVQVFRLRAMAGKQFKAARLVLLTWTGGYGSAAVGYMY
jgi:hypothetical protein